VKVETMNLNEVASNSHQNLCDRCLRNPHYLILHKKYVSRLAAFLLLVSFFIFVAGYFFGKKKLAEDFSHVAEHASFSDQINFAISSLYDKELHAPKAKDVSLAENVSDTDKTMQENLDNKEVLLTHAEAPIIKQSDNQKKWLAQLFGGTEKQVTDFANRLSKKGISVEIRKRVGNTARGKKIHWYQAVTQPFDNQSDLNDLVAKIITLENIKVGSDAIIAIPA
jgi:hypothetical protein